MDNSLITCVEHIFAAQMKYPQDVHFGSIWCPHHGCHIRAAEAMYPLAYYSLKRKNNDYKQASIHLANWLSARQEPQGYWIDLVTEENTTAFQLLALACTFPLIKDSLGMLDNSGLKESMLKASTWCIKKISIKKVPYEYSVSLALALLLIAEEFGIEEYKKKARYITTHIAKKVSMKGCSPHAGENELFLHAYALYSIIVNNKKNNTADNDTACILPTVYQAFKQAFRSQYTHMECRENGFSL